MKLFNLSKEFNVLPYPGALIEQPSGVIERFEVIIEVRNELDEAASQDRKPPD